MWEIWSRKLPFMHYQFDYEISRAVLEGERPLISEDYPQPITDLMRWCWSPKPGDRPTFHEIVARLTALQQEPRNC